MIKCLRVTWLDLCFVACLALCFAADYCSNVRSTYAAVTDPAVIWVRAADQFTTHEQFALSVPDHLVRDGKLYLKVQVTSPILMLFTAVNSGKWDAVKVSRFRRDHPELESYWPDPERAGGGVRWLRP